MFSFNKLLGACCIFSYSMIRLEYIKQPNTSYASALNICTQFTNSFRCLQASLVLSMWRRQKNTTSKAELAEDSIKCRMRL